MDMITYALCCKKINSIDKGAKVIVAQQLPTKGEANTIYLIPKDDSGNNDIFDEYIYANSEWEKIGSTAIDLTDYVQNTDYATDSAAGVIKTSSDMGAEVDNNGLLKSVTKTYSEYENLSSSSFISKGTLNNYVAGAGLVSSSDLATVAASGDYNDLNNIPDVLEKNNITAYTPSGDYNPATKKYVDDAINASITTVLGGSY